MFHCVNWSPIEQFIIIQNSTINRPGVDSVVDLWASKKVLDEDNVLKVRNITCGYMVGSKYVSKLRCCCSFGPGQHTPLHMQAIGQISIWTTDRLLTSHFHTQPFPPSSGSGSLAMEVLRSCGVAHQFNSVAFWRVSIAFKGPFLFNIGGVVSNLPFFVLFQWLPFALCAKPTTIVEESVM